MTPFQRLCLLAVFAAAGIAAIAAPEQMLLRFAQRPDPVLDHRIAVQAFGCVLLALGVALFEETGAAGPRRRRIAGLAFLAGLPAIHVLFTAHLGDWWIDDAGITFAYARSLAEGHGLTFHPGRPAEEGYSSTLWMLLLALARTLGGDIQAVAKHVGVLSGAAALVLALDLVRRAGARPSGLVLTFALVVTAPFVVWTASGQEHALQGLLLMLVVYAMARLERWHAPVAVLLAALVLTRPEAPLIVAAVFAAGLALSCRAGRGLDLGRTLPVAAVPFAVFLGLFAFRYAYFGDLMPNPYHAKASGASFAGLLNPFGGGWSYVLGALRDTALLLAVGFLALWRGAGIARAGVWGAAAVLGGHLVFVIWAKGDWMGQYRFLMPVLPVLGVVLALAVLQAGRDLRGGAVLATGAALILMQSTVTDLVAFRERPTTPLSAVTAVGDAFAGLARRMGIADPTLAHHDAGGIAYNRRIELIDLGGLVDGRIARHMRDRDFLVDYLLTQRRPDFFFGARNFAALSGFAETPAFARAYVPVEFVAKPYMDSYLGHMRRDLVRPAPGIVIRRDGGEIAGVTVHPEDG